MKKGEMEIGIPFLIGVLVGQWLNLWALWQASMNLIGVLSDIQRNNKSTPSRNKAIIIPNDFLDLDNEEAE